MGDKWEIFFLSIWLLIGGVFLTIGVFMYNGYKRKRNVCTLTTRGKVIDLLEEETNDSDGHVSCAWYPVIEYHIGGKQYIKKYSYGTSELKYAVGDNVLVFFNPEDFDEYMIAFDDVPRILPLIFMFIGGVVFLAGIVSAVTIYFIK